MVNIVEKAVRAACQPADRRPPWQWCEENFFVTSGPMPGRWKSSNSPWVKEFMEDFADNRVSTISVMCSAQSSKTETMLGLLNWLIDNDPGGCMWVTSNEEEALKFCTERAMKSLKACPKIMAQMPKSSTGELDRKLVKSQEIFFPRMPLEFIGSNSEAKLQSKPRRWLLLDEVRNWPPGALPMVLKRTRAFWNARRVIISTPDAEHDPVHQEFLKGNQKHYYVKCPTCGHKQLLIWERIGWDDNETTRPSGIWNFDAMAETIHFKCEDTDCPSHVVEKRIKDHPVNRRKMVSEGEWREHNPGAPRSVRSYTWNAILPPWVKWRDLVEEFINAHKALSWGDHEPLKTFINESLGQPWDDRLKYGDDDYLEKRQEDYLLGKEWDDETHRFISFDVQKDHFRFVCRAFGPIGSSRLIDYGKLMSWEEVRMKIKELHVDDDNVILDAAHRTAEVYKMVAESGYRWKPFWGDERRYFNFKGARTIFMADMIDPAMGSREQGRVRPIRLITWSNPSAKDMLLMMMKGISGNWTISKHVTKEYLDQITAERREEFTDARGQVTFKWVRTRRDNHYGDCELMILVAAVINRIIGIPERITEAVQGLTVGS
jgi:phage terminase large subunit GpA-like protein